MKTGNMFFVKAAAVLIALSTSTMAFAQERSVGGLFVEPGVTYERGDTTIDYPSPFQNSTGSANGFGLMGRLGVHVHEIVFLGLDARYAMPHFKDSSVSYDADATSFNWGPVVGIQTPLLGIRVWGNYVAGGNLDPKKSGNLDVKFEESTGYRVGAGLHWLMLSINLEYQNLKYGKAVLESIGGFNAGETFSSVKPKNESWILSVSFPLEI